MIVRGLSEQTRESYLRAVRGLTSHYHRSPDQISQEQIQAYLVHLYVERKRAWSTCNVIVHALRFFYHTTLDSERTHFTIPSARRPSRLPDILSREEVARLFVNASTPQHRTMLVTAYATGLRVSELVRLKLTDIDADRHTIRVTQGKGARDRYALLSDRLLTELRQYWRQYRPAIYLFPSSRAERPMSIGVAQRAYTEAKIRARIVKSGGIHALRHAFATHMLEAGAPVHTIQRLLGHESIRTTLRYIHLAQHDLAGAKSPLDLLEVQPGPLA